MFVNDEITKKVPINYVTGTRKEGFACRYDVHSINQEQFPHVSLTVYV